jgi:hypothetical protein
MLKRGTDAPLVRKRGLMLYLHSTRQQLLRMVALVQWSPKAKALAECVGPDKVMDKAAGHVRMIHAAVDDMCAAHVERVSRYVPMWDVQTALEVMSTGEKRRGGGGQGSNMHLKQYWHHELHGQQHGDPKGRSMSAVAPGRLQS